MKHYILLFLTIFSFSSSVAQTDEEPVIWSHEVLKIAEGEFEIEMRGIIMDGWHVYSQYTAEGGEQEPDAAALGDLCRV